MTPTTKPPSAASSSGTVWTANDLRDDPHQCADKARRVQAMFGAIAGRYDLNNRLHSFGRDQAWRRAAVRLCRVQPTDHVLDVACGTGDLAEAFCRAGPARVVGVDFTEPMLDLARRKARRRRRRADEPVPAYEAADAMALPYDDASFDVVSIAFGLRNVADPAAALIEFRRVLRPGGRVVVLEFSEPERGVIRALNRFYTRRVMPVTATIISGDRTGAYRYLPASVGTFHDRASMRKLMEQVGFDRVGLHAFTFGVCVAYLGHVPNAASGAA